MFPTRESTEATEPTPVGEPERRSRSRSWGGFVAGLGMLVAGVAVGWLVFGGPVEDALQDPVTETPVVEPSVDASAEPVAAVAESLLPSVVQINTGAGVGSGVVYDSDGLILTAAHVVAGADDVMVRLADGTQHSGRVVGGDVPADIAVVEVDATDLPAAPLALDDELQVGQLAVAIGSPFGLDSTVTSGVVSALNQTVGRGGDFQALIQTDAAINPGNSGGALANREGEVIGINVSIFSASGGNDGVGFAVPIDVADNLARSIVSGEPITKGVLGITGTNSEDGSNGTLVTQVVPGSGAEAAGLDIGDVILSVDGVRVEGIGDLIAQLGGLQPGDTVILEIVRSGEPADVEVTLGGSDG